MSDFITPTVGRVVWFYPAAKSAESDFVRNHEGGPYAAVIARVWHDGMVNLSVMDANGNPHSRTSVPLLQGGEAVTNSAFCTWMPFQKGQARAQAAVAEANSQKAANGPVVVSHASAVLYPAIRNAMEELAALHPGFNDHVNRAWNHLHRAFWSEVPAPASAPGLRDELPAAEPGIDLSPTKQQDASAGLIQVEGVTAPRVSQGDVEDEIVKSTYFVFPDTTLTVCCIHLRNGFPVVGESACVSRKNFDPARGRELAYEDAKRKIWPLMGYALKQRLHDAD